MKRVLSLIFVLMLGLSTAQAQEAAKPTATHLQAARAMIDSSGMGRSFVALLPQFLAEAKASLTATRPEITKDLDAVIVQLNKEFAPQVEDLQMAASHSIAARFTEAEVKDLDTFFRSPLGKKYVEEQPKMLDGIFRAMQDWGQATSLMLMDRIRTEMKKRGHEL